MKNLSDNDLDNVVGGICWSKESIKDYMSLTIEGELNQIENPRDLIHVGGNNQKSNKSKREVSNRFKSTNL